MLTSGVTVLVRTDDSRDLTRLYSRQEMVVLGIPLADVVQTVDADGLR